MAFVKAFVLTLIVLAVVSVVFFDLAKPHEPAESTPAPLASGGNATSGTNATNASGGAANATGPANATAG